METITHCCTLRPTVLDARSENAARNTPHRSQEQLEQRAAELKEARQRLQVETKAFEARKDQLLEDYRHLYWTCLMVVDGYEAHQDRKYAMGPNVVEECE